MMEHDVEVLGLLGLVREENELGGYGDFLTEEFQNRHNLKPFKTPQNTVLKL
jgi:hypothetical protein